ncbi:hypothetical protein O181_092486 [Austropuccinia psidii MF-1]|uniref:Uncharacterized protein n=1 Tax=Austropuccinia psidii MF-1 TaxID=1389203 RepID=A0A9Q3PAN4_9BASI|nr:hypothetical protein [Austropuccinia psidii MF-1]
MKEGGDFSLYIADFRSLVLRIGDWGERALIHHFRKGLPSRILDQLASHALGIHSLEKKPEASKSSSSHPQKSASSSQKRKKNFQKRDKPHSFLLNKYFKLMNSEKE